jgi:hypothetical protein
MDFAIFYEHTNDTNIKIEHQMVRKQEKNKQIHREVKVIRFSKSQFQCHHVFRLNTARNTSFHYHIHKGFLPYTVKSMCLPFKFLITGTLEET